jgi:hypothetical protein
VSLATSGASFGGYYRYNVLLPGSTWQSGVKYWETLKNTGTTESHTAYFYAKVEGYSWTRLVSAAARTSTYVDKIV